MSYTLVGMGSRNIDELLFAYVSAEKDESAKRCSLNLPDTHLQCAAQYSALLSPSR